MSSNEINGNTAQGMVSPLFWMLFANMLTSTAIWLSSIFQRQQFPSHYPPSNGKPAPQQYITCETDQILVTR